MKTFGWYDIILPGVDKMNITKDIKYIGVNDHQIDLFEGQYKVPNGMSYNSYIIMDEKIAVFDTVDKNFTHEWLDNISKVLNNRKPDYLIIQHMEPDHSANIANFLKIYPDTIVVANKKTFTMIGNFFNSDIYKYSKVVEDGEALVLGKHKLMFVFAPMVHWPEVMVTYDETDKVLFSADGFGKFGALNIEEAWADEARRYYFNIVGKYGMQVQNLLKKASKLQIDMICPLHGPVLKENLGYYLDLYNTWSSYSVEKEGICIAYTSVYGATKKAVELLKDKLIIEGAKEIVIHDLARDDMSVCVADAFKYGKLILATTTYNADIFPFMKEFINHLTERNFQNRTVGFIENGSWAPLAKKTMQAMLANSKQITYLEHNVSIMSSIKPNNKEEIELMAKELCKDYVVHLNKNDMNALFKIGYGLYVVTSNDGKQNNGLIVNTVTQVSDNPNRIAVNINKANYSYHVIKQTGILNVNCLTVDAPFKVFENFGFQSGRNTDKFVNYPYILSDNGLPILTNYINASISLKVENYIDLDSHGMFICSVTEARVMNNKETMTYEYYQKNVKPKPDTDGKKGFVCKVCGYVYEGDVLPDDYICPLCKHGASDFEPIK